MQTLESPWHLVQLCLLHGLVTAHLSGRNIRPACIRPLHTSQKRELNLLSKRAVCRGKLLLVGQKLYPVVKLHTPILCKHMHCCPPAHLIKFNEPNGLTSDKQPLDVVRMKKSTHLHASLDGICWLCGDCC